MPVMDLSGESTCTTCTFTEDLSNYWTATLFFRAQNGSFHRVPQKGNEGFESANGGMTVYYIQPYDNSAVTAFKPVSFLVLCSVYNDISNDNLRVFA